VYGKTGRLLKPTNDHGGSYRALDVGDGGLRGTGDQQNKEQE
jgi:hypothetical protein